MKIERDFYSLTLPFTVQNTDFMTGGGVNSELYPKQLQNQNLLLSSAEGIDSELYDRYVIAFKKMLLGDPEYFIADINCEMSLHPYINGKPTPPLVSQSTIDDAFKTNPYRAEREYYNKFDNDGGENVLVKRSVINKNSVPMFPVFENDGTKKYMISYDPASKLDNSVICVAELFRDEEKGLMLRLVNCKNLIEKIGNEKAVIQKPEQIEILKDMIVDYNKGAIDYENLDMVIIDAGAGGGGADVASFLMNEWKGKDKRTHIGFIDVNDPYMQLRLEDFPSNSDKLQMFNFKRDKTMAYERTRRAINEGLVIFPASVNARGEIEFEETDSNGDVVIKYEKVDNKDLDALIQFDLCKEELVSMQSVKTPNGNVKFDLSTEAKQKNMHDDHADVICQLCNRLMELRALEALEVEGPQQDDLSKLFVGKKQIKKNKNPFENKSNPFITKGYNPFK